MKTNLKKLVTIIILTVGVCTNTFAQTFQWAKSFGGVYNESSSAIAMDQSGNIYNAGDFKGTVDFDPGPGVYNMISSVIQGGLFVTKLDAQGNFIWAKKIEGTNNIHLISFFLDTVGNLLINGNFKGTADFDSDTSSYHLTSNGNSDFFVCKWDANGAFIWAKSFGNSDDNILMKMALDKNNNVFLSGDFKNSIDIDPDTGIYNLVSSGNNDIYILKLNSNGIFKWAHRFGSTGRDYATTIEIDKSNRIWLTGAFENQVDFDPGAGVFNLIATGLANAFIEKLDTAGNFIWAGKMSSTGSAILVSQKSTIDSFGNFILSGYFSGTVDFNPGLATNNFAQTLGNTNGFLLKLDSSGNYIRNLQYVTNQGQVTWNSLLTDISGNLYATGGFEGTTDFDPGIGTNNYTADFSYPKIFILKLDTGGNFLSIKVMGKSQVWNFISATMFDKFETSLYVTGGLRDTLDFNPPFASNIIAVGMLDAFVAKYTIGGVGIDDNKNLGPNYLIYPNPTSGRLTINLKEQTKYAEVSILNSLGQELSITNYFNISSLEMQLEGGRGLYFVRIKTDSKITCLKVMKE